jgi:hypothetical protein
MLPLSDRWNWRRYIRRLGRRVGIAEYAWWEQHIERIIATLRGRYEVVKLGVDPGPPERLFKLIWRSDPRPMWASHKTRAASKDAMLRLVAIVERRARRDGNAPDCASEESR